MLNEKLRKGVINPRPECLLKFHKIISPNKPQKILTIPRMSHQKTLSCVYSARTLDNLEGFDQIAPHASMTSGHKARRWHARSSTFGSSRLTWNRSKKELKDRKRRGTACVNQTSSAKIRSLAGGTVRKRRGVVINSRPRYCLLYPREVLATHATIFGGRDRRKDKETKGKEKTKDPSESETMIPRRNACLTSARNRVPVGSP